MTEDDLLGGGAREPLRSCCIKLAGRLWALCQRTGFEDLQPLQARQGARPPVACSTQQVGMQICIGPSAVLGAPVSIPMKHAAPNWRPHSQLLWRTA